MNKKGNTQKAISLLVLVTFGAVAGFFIGKWGASFGQNAKATAVPSSVMIALPVLFILSFLIVIAIHEGGHALAGVWMKFDFRMYVVGPFMWNKQQTGWQFKWNKNVNTAGGMVICMPVGSENLSKRFSIYAAGGPAASLALAGFAYAIALLLPGIETSIQILHLFFLITALLSLMIFAVTSIPMHMGGFYSDGARILRLNRGGDKARFDILILQIITGSAGGIRPKLLSISDLEEASKLANQLKEPFGVYLLSYFHQAAFDEGDMVMAENYLLEYVSKADAIPAGIRNAVWLDAAFFYAIVKSDLEKSNFYWNQFKPTAMIPKAQVFATEAAMSYLKNDLEKTTSAIESAIKELPDMLDKGVAIALEEKMLNLKSALVNK
jgi:Peptidase family M50